jgi:hypothetical protein
VHRQATARLSVRLAPQILRPRSREDVAVSARDAPRPPEHGHLVRQGICGWNQGPLEPGDE